jgi:quinoprotein glucose dehydrogenase
MRTPSWLGASAASLLALAVGSVGASAIQRGLWYPARPLPPDASNFSELDHVRKSNVGLLKVAWFYPHASTGSNPIVVGDVAYVQGRNNALVALNAATGREIWIHENLTGFTPRGMNYWQSRDGRDRRIFFSISSYLQAIDARTGQSILSFGKSGIVDLREGLARGPGTIRIQSSSPGKVFENLLILGSAPGEQWVSPPGDIRAYDVITGRLVWQFHTVPRPGEFGYETWPKDAHKYVGGNNAWAEFSVDEARGIVYVPTGSPTYDFYGADRHGANLFGNCLLALDARTGRRLWHFQTVHHDLWDYDNVSAPQLITVQHGGRRIDAVAHAGKTGFLYVFDRVTGQPLWPIEERPVPPSDIPGEQAWPTQPFPTVVPPFARQSFTIDDVNPYLRASDYAVMRDRVAKARNLGLFTPPAFIDTIQMPGNQGGSNWGTTAANPSKGIVYVLNVDAVAILRLIDVRANTSANLSGVFGAAVYQKYCQVCHGPEGSGGAMPGAPALTNLTSRFSDEALRIVVTNGQGQMAPVQGITDTELAAVVAYLRQGAPSQAGRGSTPTFPPGPVVASGGAPRPAAPGPIAGAPQFGGNGGNGGNEPYPADAEGVPTVRYVSEYGVLATSTRPPYSTLTAYDLNTGAIKWRVPTGDDPSTISRGGPTNTGGVLLRTGILPTSTGLVFLAGIDGKVRAFDEDTGHVLWTGTLSGSSRGIPAMYEAGGRQYLLVSATPGSGSASSNAPRGWIAFALSR